MSEMLEILEQEANGKLRLLLWEPCSWCKPMREALYALQRTFNGNAQLMFQPFDEDGLKKGEELDATGGFRIDCEHCHGSMRVPTEAGRKLLEFIKTFVADVRKWAKAKDGTDDEVAF